MQLLAGGGIVYLILAYMNKWPPFNKGGIGSEFIDRLSKPATDEGGTDLSQTPPAINPFESTVPPGSFELGMGAQMPFPGPAGNSPATPGQFPASTPQNDPTNVQYGIYTQYLNGLRSEQQRARDELNKLNEGNVGIGGDITTLPQPPVTPGMSGMGIPPMFGGPVIHPIPHGRYGAPGVGMMPPQMPFIPIHPPFMPIPMFRGVHVMVHPQKPQYDSNERVTIYATGLAPFEPATVKLIGKVERGGRGGITIGNWLSIGGREGRSKDDIETKQTQSDPMGRISPTQIKLPDTTDGIVTVSVIGASGKTGSITINVKPDRRGGNRGGISIGGPGGINIGGGHGISIGGGMFGGGGFGRDDDDFNLAGDGGGMFGMGNMGSNINDMVRGMFGGRSFYADTTFTEYDNPFMEPPSVVPQDINSINPTLMGLVSRNQPMGTLSNKLGNIR